MYFVDIENKYFIAMLFKILNILIYTKMRNSFACHHGRHMNCTCKKINVFVDMMVYPISLLRNKISRF